MVFVHSFLSFFLIHGFAMVMFLFCIALLPRLLIPDENQNNNDENTFKTLVFNKYKHYKRDYNTKDTKLSKFFTYKNRKSHKNSTTTTLWDFPPKKR